MPETRVAVLVLTFRRPGTLEKCLASLARQVDVDADWAVIVVDNDDAPSASPVVAGAMSGFPVPLRYVHHPVPGLSSARNRALDESADFDVIAFIDDDEVADTDWLRQLLGALENSNAAVAQGHVASDLEPGGPLWAHESGVFDRPLAAPLQQLQTASSGNVAVRVKAVAGARFAERFNFTGGEDTDFFLRLVKAGNNIVAVPSAVVVEQVPRSRQTYSWLFRRGYRASATWTVIERELSPRFTRVPMRLASALRDILVAVGLLAASTRPSRRSRSLPVAVQRTAKAVGSIGGLLGFIESEYHRS